ncbi:MAG: hypothetical protein JWR61_5688 [Ferruginibacter sp.]|nr:hypothetical protein [Ferruginibacter sp.]
MNKETCIHVQVSFNCNEDDHLDNGIRLPADKLKLHTLHSNTHEQTIAINRLIKNNNILLWPTLFTGLSLHNKKLNNEKNNGMYDGGFRHLICSNGTD